ncbi:MAG: hypothetical protein DWH97_08460, partial [Planctomycetota bacterium]
MCLAAIDSRCVIACIAQNNTRPPQTPVAKRFVRVLSTNCAWPRSTDRVLIVPGRDRLPIVPGRDR